MVTGRQLHFYSSIVLSRYEAPASACQGCVVHYRMYTKQGSDGCRAC